MLSVIDYDAFEYVFESSPCPACGGNLSRCNGACTGSASMTMRLRPPEEYQRIKAEKRRTYEDRILAEADTIRASRANLGG